MSYNSGSPFYAKALFLLAVAAPLFGQLQTITYRPVDAAYSTLLDKLIMVNANPSQLHIYDPVSRIDQPLALPLPPTSLSVSADGRYAAVGHYQYVSWVDLQVPSVVRTTPVSSDVAKVVVAGSWIYTFPRTYGTMQYVSTVTGSVTNAPYDLSLTAAAIARRDGSALYVAALSTLQRYDVSRNGAPVTTGSVTYQTCGGLWFSDDTRLFTGCGLSLSSAAGASGDLTYRGNLNTRVRSLAWSQSRNEVAVVPEAWNDRRNQGSPTEVRILSHPYLNETGRFTLPLFTSGSRSAPSHGRSVFYSNDGTRLIVLLTADPAAGFLIDFGIAVFNYPSSCSASFSVTSAQAADIGASGTVTVSGSQPCIWQATTSASWLSVTANATSFGSSSLTWYAQQNGTASARTASVTIGNQTFSVSQAARAGAPQGPVALPYAFVDAEYSKPLDRIAILSSAPNQLHLYDGANKLETRSVALPLAPREVSVSPDGKFAAVSHDAWVSHVNLTTGVLEKTLPVSETLGAVVHGGTHIYALPDLSSYGAMRVIEIASGAQTAIANSSGRAGVLSVDSTSLFTTIDSNFVARWRLSAGVPQLDKVSTQSSCGGFWPSADSLRLFSACGSVFRLSDSKNEDLSASPGLVRANYLQSLVHLPNRNLLFVLPGFNLTELQRYRYSDLMYESKFPLPAVVSSGFPVQSAGHHVFASADESKLYVLLSAHSSEDANPPPPTYAFDSLPVDTQTACQVAISPTTLSSPQEGRSVSVSGSTQPGCSWSVTSPVSWVGGAPLIPGVGSGSFTLRVNVNLTTAGRSATLDVSGAPLVVTQVPGLVCTYSVPDSVFLASVPTNYVLPIFASPGCPWTVIPSTSSFLSFFVSAQDGSFGDGLGSGFLHLYPSTNQASTSRSTTMTVAGKTLTVIQAGANDCQATLSVPLTGLPATGTTGTAALAFAGTCTSTWNVTGLPSWFQIFPQQGTTSAPTQVSHTVFPQFSTRLRRGTIQLSGVPFIPIQQSSASGLPDERFVRHIYFAFFGRYPTPAEVSFQITQALNKGTTREDLALGFLNSPEFNQGGRFIAGLYVGLLNRDAEFAGWLFQRNALATGFVNPTLLVTNFLGSAEWIGKFGNPSDAEFVRLLYRNILLREPSQPEVDFQAAALKTLTRVAMATSFLNSAEFRISTGARLTAFLLRATLLNREGSAAEFNSFVSRLSSGTVPKTLIGEIVQDAEFTSLVN